MVTRITLTGLVALGCVASACAFDVSGPETTSSPVPDAGRSSIPATPDAATTPADAGMPEPDAAPPEPRLCPQGAVFEAGAGFCVTDREAFGPFPRAMIEACERASGGAACAAEVAVPVRDRVVFTQRWSIAMAYRARGSGPCPLGSIPDFRTGDRCVETTGDYMWVYGPFSVSDVDHCVALLLDDDDDDGDEAPCLLGRWSMQLFELVHARGED